jgi:hypothetical protein
MRDKSHVILIYITCICFYLSSIQVQALSLNATAEPLVSIPAYLTDVPRAYITGYVLDEDGKPVPHATVSLWQDNQLWRTKYLYVPSDNPQTTRISYTNESDLNYLHEGAFLFGYTYPGEYTLIAEVEGYKSSLAKVNVGNETLSPNQLESAPCPIYMNITLSGYHVPTIKPDQQANSGVIIGSLRSKYGYGGGGKNVSLWQDGRIVEMPDNPQSSFQRNYSGKEVDYVFEHLAPGQYMVMVEYYAGTKYNETAYIDVDTNITTADIMITHEPPPPMPSPTLPGLVVLFIIMIVAYYATKKK